METLIRNHIIDHMKKNNLFSEKQYGFISGRSTTLQLLTVQDHWTEALDKGMSIDILYMDFQKAIDVVPHRKVLGKLKTYGQSDVLVAWISAFHIGRSQKVSINGYESVERPVLSGIPQSSVLGLMLFVLYINHLPESVISHTFVFAEDTKMYSIISKPSDCELLQKLLSLTWGPFFWTTLYVCNQVAYAELQET